MFYPIFLNLEGRPVLVVGGGHLAERKVEGLLEAGAVVHLVSPDLTTALQDLENSGTIQIRKGRFEERDLEGIFLVVSATDEPETQERVAASARARHILINTVDQPHLCDFILPAIVRREDVVLAVSTSGKSPALAAELRKKLSTVVTPDAARVARVLGDLRAEVHERFPDPDRRKQIFDRIIASGILDWIGQYDDVEARAKAREVMESAE